MKGRGNAGYGNDAGRVRRDVMRAVCAVLAVVLLLLGMLLGMRRWQQAYYAVGLSGAEEDGSREKSVEWNGQNFCRKDRVETYLIMGIDADGPARSNKSYIGGGQADLQIVLVLDERAKTWQLLQLNRDTLADVPVLGVTGEVVGSQYEQIALAHSYGDGLESSCINNVNTVSALLQQQKIDGYFAVNMGAVSIFNDMLGGVTVTVTEDFSAADPSLALGETVTLSGQQALNFVRSRYNVGDQTNLSRMERQRQYLEALVQLCSGLETQTVWDAYAAVGDYIVTDMGEGEIASLADKLKRYSGLERLTVEGNAYLDDTGAMAYELDPESLQETILALFYEAEETGGN